MWTKGIIKRNAYFLISLFFTLNVMAQKDQDILGFACFYSGAMTKPVEHITSLLENKEYDKIRKMLIKEKDPARQFLEVFVLEKLYERGVLPMYPGPKEQKYIEAIKHSEDLVPVCSGCTYLEKVALKDLFNPDDKHQIYILAEYWFDARYATKPEDLIRN